MLSNTVEMTDGAKRFVDEDDQNVCGFVTLQTLDSDGYAKKTKGTAIEAPFHLVSSGEEIVLEANFPANALFFLQISNEDNYLFGRWWIGDATWSKTNQLCQVVPLRHKDIVKALEKDGSGTFTAGAEVPFLPRCSDSERLVRVNIETQEVKYVTKVVRVSVVIPKDLWNEWKQYRLKLWRRSKQWAGEDKTEDKKKKDEEVDKDL
uniref:Uncharacterized protein n=1 Tax=Noctiluca scintillans TaxID=2966 RepID=A0A7S1APT1_NOCSC|mmetsp:Transcript_54940/g.146707  ORF Transcript_54940/g.146707 Transcript_54940/m.146707 type:complete len:206 (+) Transcript_54940:72-689(+)